MTCSLDAVGIWIGYELVDVELDKVEYVSHSIAAKTGPTERLINFLLAFRLAHFMVIISIFTSAGL